MGDLKKFAPPQFLKRVEGGFGTSHKGDLPKLRSGFFSGFVTPSWMDRKNPSPRAPWARLVRRLPWLRIGSREAFRPPRGARRGRFRFGP